jgi:predicted metallopeptidase
MKYEIDENAQEIVKDVVEKLKLNHIRTERVICLKSHGSKSRRTVARIHGLSKIMQKAMRTKAFYAIELISENFDKLEKEEKIKTIVHELMHIPKCFGGGFRSHRPYVTRRKVEKVFNEYKKSLNQ